MTTYDLPRATRREGIGLLRQVRNHERQGPCDLARCPIHWALARYNDRTLVRFDALPRAVAGYVAEKLAARP